MAFEETCVVSTRCLGASLRSESFDLWANLGETTVLKDIHYRSFVAGLSATWRVTDNFTVSP
jgi:hypothetical protein